MTLAVLRAVEPSDASSREDHVSHDLPLARCQRAIAAVQSLTVRPLRASLAGTLQPQLDRVEQILVAKGLRQKFHHAAFRRPHRHRDVAVGRDEHDRNVQIGLGHPPLQIKPAQTRKPHIKDQTAGRTRRSAAQEILSRGEDLDAESD